MSLLWPNRPQCCIKQTGKSEFDQQYLSGNLHSENLSFRSLFGENCLLRWDDYLLVKCREIRRKGVTIACEGGFPAPWKYLFPHFYNPLYRLIPARWSHIYRRCSEQGSKIPSYIILELLCVHPLSMFGSIHFRYSKFFHVFRRFQSFLFHEFYLIDSHQVSCSYSADEKKHLFICKREKVT